MAKERYAIARNMLLEEVKRARKDLSKLFESDTGIRKYDALQEALDRYKSCLAAADVLAGYEEFEGVKYYKGEEQ